MRAPVGLAVPRSDFHNIVIPVITDPELQLHNGSYSVLKTVVPLTKTFHGLADAYDNFSWIASNNVIKEDIQAIIKHLKIYSPKDSYFLKANSYIELLQQCLHQCGMQLCHDLYKRENAHCNCGAKFPPYSGASYRASRDLFKSVKHLLRDTPYPIIPRFNETSDTVVDRKFMEKMGEAYERAITKYAIDENKSLAFASAGLIKIISEMSPQPMCYTYDWPVPKSWKNAWEASGNVVLDNELPLLCSAHVDPPCGPFEKSYSQLYDKVIAHLVSKKIIDQWDKDDETEDAEEAQNDDQDPSDDEEHEEKAENEEDETRFDSISQRGFDNEENSLSLSPNSHLMESSRSQAVPVNLDTQHVSRNVVLNTDGQQLYQKLQSIPPEKDILIGGGYDGNENCNRDILNSQSTDLDMGSATVQDLNNAVLEGIKDYLGGDITNADDLLNNSDLLHNFESLAATGEFDPEGKEIIEGENESSVSAPTDPSQTARKSISPSPSVEEHEVMEKNDNIRVSRSNGEPPALDDGEDITTSTPNKDVFKAPVEKTVPDVKGADETYVTDYKKCLDLLRRGMKRNVKYYPLKEEVLQFQSPIQNITVHSLRTTPLYELNTGILVIFCVERLLYPMENDAFYRSVYNSPIPSAITHYNKLRSLPDNTHPGQEIAKNARSFFRTETFTKNDADMVELREYVTLLPLDEHAKITIRNLSIHAIIGDAVDEVDPPPRAVPSPARNDVVPDEIDRDSTSSSSSDDDTEAMDVDDSCSSKARSPIPPAPEYSDHHGFHLKYNVGDLILADSSRSVFWPALVKEVHNDRLKIDFFPLNNNNPILITNITLIKPFVKAEIDRIHDSISFNLTQKYFKKAVEAATKYAAAQFV
uniref:PWWP domain-containing protein n=1 Tax=Trichogramma kaykai TaxID=54128 RepID=A0ABD2WB69_9HYME